MSADGPAIDKELEALRRHGFGVAYRMLGSVSDAEDVAQEPLVEDPVAITLPRDRAPSARSRDWNCT
jgi:hypothetical protein